MGGYECSVMISTRDMHNMLLVKDRYESKTTYTGQSYSPTNNHPIYPCDPNPPDP